MSERKEKKEITLETAAEMLLLLGYSAVAGLKSGEIDRMFAQWIEERGTSEEELEEVVPPLLRAKGLDALLSLICTKEAGK